MSGRRLRLSFANIAATLALLLAVGGTWALAFSGSGKLQKATVSPLGEGMTVVRPITGVGELRATCSDPGGNVNVGLINTSGESLRVFAKEFNGTVGNFIEAELTDESDLDAFIGGWQQTGLVRYYVFPSNGSKRPQADVTVSIEDEDDDCDTAQVSVLDLTTEE